MPFMLDTPKDLALRLAERVREDRLSRGWSQAQFAARVGMGERTYRLFEATGQISVDRLLTIAIALGRAAEWDQLFRPRAAASLDDLDRARPARKRAPRKRSHAKDSRDGSS